MPRRRRRPSESQGVALAGAPGRVPLVMKLEAVPFDPTQPHDGALIVAEVLRDQFNALEAEIVARVTQAAFDAAVAALNNAIAQCPNYGWVVDVVNTAQNSTLTTALGQSSNNSNNVATFDEAAYSYYDQGQMDRFIAKVNELINGLRRV